MNFKHLALVLMGGFFASSAQAVEEGYPVYYNAYASDASCYSYDNRGVCNQRGSMHQAYRQSTQSTRVSKREGYKKFTEKRPEKQLDLGIWAGRRFADFEYQLNFGYSYNSSDYTHEGPAVSKSAGSILEWDDMIFNEIGITARKDFQYDKYPLFVFGEYKQGKLAKSGDSRDDDLTVDDLWDISIGGIDASTSGWKFGLGWNDAFTWADFTFSPVIGYMSQTHDLNMTNQIYPQPEQTVYMYGPDGDGDGNPDPIYDDAGNHTCLWNTDLEQLNPVGGGDLYANLDADPEGEVVYQDGGVGWITCTSAVDNNYCGTYDPIWNGLSYQDVLLFDTDGQVGTDGCLLGGYDVAVALGGQTQKYQATWSGFFIGTYMDRQFNEKESLSFYGHVAMLDYEATADWVYRTDLAHPSFKDAASGMGYELRMTYTREFAPSWDFKLSVDWETFELEGGTSTVNYADGSTASEPFANYAVWQSMGLQVGVVRKF
ncbi:MAG: hypothetical protein JW812_00470 [Alphaproteobacteria bacterium]|nr:hypothetical protein [Alphaproteobacteria bacterium]MBN2780100.1 hypothetical protein [Alphaproteobacteria bacterium]